MFGLFFFFQDLETKLDQDVGNAKAYGASLTAQIDGLKMVPTLFGVINFWQLLHCYTLSFISSYLYTRFHIQIMLWHLLMVFNALISWRNCCLAPQNLISVQFQDKSGAFKVTTILHAKKAVLFYVVTMFIAIIG